MSPALETFLQVMLLVVAAPMALGLLAAAVLGLAYLVFMVVDYVRSR